MHELGIVFHIIRSVEKVAAENDLEKVSAVVLELGEVSGVVPDYLTDCWKWAAAKSETVSGAELRIETLPTAMAAAQTIPRWPTGAPAPAAGAAAPGF